MRTALERAFGCPAYDVYGLSEIVGQGCGGVRGARRAASGRRPLPAEIVDPATGAVRRSARKESFVLTTLTKRAMPLIRYRTGDITTLTDARASAGAPPPGFARIKGRTDDMLIVKGVNLYPRRWRARCSPWRSWCRTTSCWSTGRTTLARLEVQVEPAPAVVERCGGFDAAHPILVDLRRRVGERWPGPSGSRPR